MASEQIKVPLPQTEEGSSAIVDSRELRNAEIHHECHIPWKLPLVAKESNGATQASAISLLSSYHHSHHQGKNKGQSWIRDLTELRFLDNSKSLYSK